jgi:hypothetical protein
MSITSPNRQATCFNATATLFSRPHGGRMGRKFFDHLGVAKPVMWPNGVVKPPCVMGQRLGRW